MTEGTLELVAVVEKTATDEKGGEDVEGEREAQYSGGLESWSTIV